MTGAEATFHVPREECVGDFFHALVSPNLSIINPTALACHSLGVRKGALTCALA